MKSPPAKKPTFRRKSSQRRKPTLTKPEPEPEVQSDHELHEDAKEDHEEEEEEELHSDDDDHDEHEEPLTEVERRRAVIHHERPSGIPYIARPHLRVPKVWARHLHQQVPVTRRGTLNPLIPKKPGDDGDQDDVS